MADKKITPPETTASSSTSAPEKHEPEKPARERPPGTKPLSEHFAAQKLAPWQRAAILARRDLLVPPTEDEPQQKPVDENTDVTLVNFRKAMDVALHGGA